MKYVLVTGAYGGMGKATVKNLIQKGYKVFALDVSAKEDQENVIPIKADITRSEDVLLAFETVKKHTDSIYAIMHFAGIYMLDSLVEMEENAFRRIFDINVNGAFLVNKVFMPLLQKNSRILITTSELAPLDPLPFTGIYGITKSALDKYAYSLKMELQLKDISVSVLRAGAVDTGMLGTSTAALDKFIESTCLYTCNAQRFKKIVESVEARCIPAQKLAEKAISVIEKKTPKFTYSINRNPLLLLLNFLPKRFQFFIIKKVLKQKQKTPF